ncbi:hypothetical protein ABK040_002315 [Willaertia magna]
MKVLFAVLNATCQVCSCGCTLLFAIFTLVLYLNYQATIHSRNHNNNNFNNLEQRCSIQTLSNLLLACSIIDFISFLLSFCIVFSAIFENYFQSSNFHRKSHKISKNNEFQVLQSINNTNNNKNKLDQDIKQYFSLSFLFLKTTCFLTSIILLSYITYLLLSDSCESENYNLFIATIILLVFQWITIGLVICCLLCTMIGILFYLIYIGLNVHSVVKHSNYLNNENSGDDKENATMLKNNNQIRNVHFSRVNVSPYYNQFIRGTSIPIPRE